MIRRSFPTAAALLTLLLSALVAPVLMAPAADAAAYPKPQLTRWEPNLTIGSGKTVAAWRSPWASTSGGRALIPSWTVSTMPDGTWLDVYVRVRRGSTVTKWKQVAQWRHGLAGGKRTTFGRQSDALAWIDTDTLKARPGKTFDRWQIHVAAWRKSTRTASPVVRAVSGVASSYTSKDVRTSKTSMSRTVDLAVPTYSQMIHRGHFPEYGGGGEAWCSPTSVSMVLRYFGRGPTSANTTWVKGADPWVDHAARYTYDSAYRGTGTWPFNTAYASRYNTDAVVSRLTNLRAMESYLKKGIPVVASIAFARGQLTGAPITSTPGHLLVVRGFTSNGSVIVNDPAGSSNAAVKRTYDRAQFERAWLRGSGGVVYLIAPRSKGLAF